MASNGSELFPPGPGELEVSLFGPGFGECVIVHLGHGDWLVADSCRTLEKRPAALDYFGSVGLDPAEHIRLVLATHWHDDHIKGLSEILRAAPHARFACSGALRSPEFQHLIAVSLGERMQVGGSGIDEIRSTFEQMRDRPSSPPRLASSGKVLWERVGEMPAEVRALSPSDAATISAVARLASAAPNDTRRGRIPDISPNHASVAVSVTVRGTRFLLGADLEENGREGFGWSAVLADQIEGAPLAEGFKVPHHGSQNGHHSGVWERMLVSQAWAAISPFKKGSVILPQPQDVRRIFSFTRNAYLTSQPRRSKFRDADRAVERTVREVSRSTSLWPSGWGHVRMRKGLDDTASNWSVDLFGDAVPLAKLASPT